MSKPSSINKEFCVTVIIPCHNHADMVCNAIDSIISQTGWTGCSFNIQIVVIDDGSSDDPKSAIEKHYEQVFNESNEITVSSIKLMYLHNEQAGGPAAARNKAAKHTWEESDVFMMLDADDLYLPEKIKKSVEIFQQDPMRTGIVYTDAIIKNLQTGSQIHEYREPFDRQRLEQQCIISNTPLINKIPFGKVGGYDESMRTCEDWDLWLRITEGFVAIHIPEPLHIYHVTGRNSTDVVPIEVWQENWGKIHQKMMQRRNDPHPN